MENKVKRILKDARDLLATEGKWIPGHLATNGKSGTDVQPKSKSAQNWCSIGAIQKVAKKNERRCVIEAEKTLAVAIAGGHPDDYDDVGYAEEEIIQWNDVELPTENGAAPPKILSGFDKAIELAEKGGINEQDA